MVVVVDFFTRHAFTVNRLGGSPSSKLGGSPPTHADIVVQHDCLGTEIGQRAR